MATTRVKTEEFVKCWKNPFEIKRRPLQKGKKASAVHRNVTTSRLKEEGQSRHKLSFHTSTPESPWPACSSFKPPFQFGRESTQDLSLPSFPTLFKL